MFRWCQDYKMLTLSRIAFLRVTINEWNLFIENCLLQSGQPHNVLNGLAYYWSIHLVYEHTIKAHWHGTMTPANAIHTKNVWHRSLWSTTTINDFMSEWVHMDINWSVYTRNAVLSQSPVALCERDLKWYFPLLKQHNYCVNTEICLRICLEKWWAHLFSN